MKSSKDLDNDLFIKAFNERSLIALGELYQSYWMILVIYLGKRFENIKDCQDIASESFYNLYKSKTSFTNIRTLRAYLFKIGVNKCLSIIERCNRCETISNDDIDYTENSEWYAKEEREEFISKQKRFQSATSYLSPKRRSIINKFIEGKSSHLIAKELNTNINNIHGHKKKALDIIKSKI